MKRANKWRRAAPAGRHGGAADPDAAVHERASRDDGRAAPERDAKIRPHTRHLHDYRSQSVSLPQRNHKQLACLQRKAGAGTYAHARAAHPVVWPRLNVDVLLHVASSEAL